jgi:hypothetical protein
VVASRRAIDSSSGAWLVHRIRSLILELALLILALSAVAFEEPLNPLRVAPLVIMLVCAWSMYRRVLLYVRGEHHRRAEIAEAARLEGATLTARTLRHHLANKLAVAVGHSEMLADDPRLPEDLGQQAHRIMTSAAAAVDAVDKLQHDILHIQLDTRVAGPPLLDLDASTRPS